MRTLIIAAALTATICGAAHAGNLVDKCETTPMAQLTVSELDFCVTSQRAMSGLKEAIAKARAEAAAEDAAKAQRAAHPPRAPLPPGVDWVVVPRMSPN